MFLISLESQESQYLLEKLIDRNLVKSKTVFKKTCHLIHRFTDGDVYINTLSPGERIFYENNKDIEFFNSNDFKELHKKYVKEGHNPNKIAKIIRNDDVEKLQEISSQTNFNFNQAIEPSIYERCSFVSKKYEIDKDITLIDYAAFFGAIKCFKYLLMNGSDLEYALMYAIAGGNVEIIHICEQNHSLGDIYRAAIMFHRNDIFKYFYDNESEDINLENLGVICIEFCNYELFSFLLDKGMKIDRYIIDTCARFGDLYLILHFINGKNTPNDLLLNSVKSVNLELIKYTLQQERTNINAMDIFLVDFIFVQLIIFYFKIFFGNF